MTAQPRVSSNQHASARPVTSWRQRLLLVAFLLTLAPLTALAHGGALELTLSPNTLAAGGELTVSGEGFAANVPLELHLTGPNGDAHFGDVAANDEGEFTQTIRIPADVVPGLYLIRAAGSNQEASAELTVGAMAGMPQSAQQTPPARVRPPAQRAIALALFLGIVVAGFARARPARLAAAVRPSS